MNSNLSACCARHSQWRLIAPMVAFVTGCRRVISSLLSRVSNCVSFKDTWLRSCWVNRETSRACLESNDVQSLRFYQLAHIVPGRHFVFPPTIQDSLFRRDPWVHVCQDRVVDREGGDTVIHYFIPNRLTVDCILHRGCDIISIVNPRDVRPTTSLETWHVYGPGGERITPNRWQHQISSLAKPQWNLDARFTPVAACPFAAGSCLR